MDESGDLSFRGKSGSSKYFIVTFLFTKNKRAVEKIIKKVHRSLSKKIKRKVGSLHSTKEKPLTRKRVLKLISEKECSIMCIILNKEKVYSNLQDEKQVLYNYVTNILLDRILNKKLIENNEKTVLTASRRETNRFLNENFKRYLTEQTKRKEEIIVEIKTPSEEKGLQVVDFASWAIFRKYENKDEIYYSIIKDKIIEENFLFK